jgi:hypothetical protein
MFWCNSFMAGWWWIFPAMGILFFLFMMFFMTRCFSRGPSCCGNMPFFTTTADTQRGGPGGDEGTKRAEGKADVGSAAKG